MTDTDDRLLAEFLRSGNERAPAELRAAVFGLIDDSVAEPPDRRFRFVAIASAAAAIVVLVVGLALLDTGREDPFIAPAPTTTPAFAPTTTSPTTTAAATTVSSGVTVDDLTVRLREPVSAYLGDRWSVTSAAAIHDVLDDVPLEDVPDDLRIGDLGVRDWVRAVLAETDEVLAAGTDADLSGLYDLLVPFVVEVPDAGPHRIPGTGRVVGVPDAPAGQYFYVTWRPTTDCTWNVRFENNDFDDSDSVYSGRGGNLAVQAFTVLESGDDRGPMTFTSEGCGDWFRRPDPREPGDEACGWCSDVSIMLDTPEEGVQRLLEPLVLPTPWPPPRALVASVPGDLIGRPDDEPYEVFAGEYEPDGSFWAADGRLDIRPTPAAPIVVTGGEGLPPSSSKTWYYLYNGVAHPDVATVLYALSDGDVRTAEPTDLSGGTGLGFFVLPIEVDESFQARIAWIVGLDADGLVVGGIDQM